MFLSCLFSSLFSSNLIILRVSEYLTLLQILLIYYIKFFNFGSFLNRNLTPAHSVLAIRDQMGTGGLDMTVTEST